MHADCVAFTHEALVAKSPLLEQELEQLTCSGIHTPLDSTYPASQVQLQSVQVFGALVFHDANGGIAPLLVQVPPQTRVSLTHTPFPLSVNHALHCQPQFSQVSAEILLQVALAGIGQFLLQVFQQATGSSLIH